MNREEHHKYLDYLKTLDYKFGDVLPKKEGAFWFDPYMTLPEYIEAYENELFSKMMDKEL